MGGADRMNGFPDCIIQAGNREYTWQEEINIKKNNNNPLTFPEN